MVADQTINVFRENMSLGSIDFIAVAVLKGGGGGEWREGEGKEASVNWKNCGEKVLCSITRVLQQKKEKEAKNEVVKPCFHGK